MPAEQGATEIGLYTSEAMTTARGLYERMGFVVDGDLPTNFGLRYWRFRRSSSGRLTLARIWYESFVHPVEQAPYIERLQAMPDQVAAPGVSFEVHGLDPPDHSFHALTEFRCAAQVIGNALDGREAPATTPS